MGKQRLFGAASFWSLCSVSCVYESARWNVLCLIDFLLRRFAGVVFCLFEGFLFKSWRSAKVMRKANVVLVKLTLATWQSVVTFHGNPSFHVGTYFQIQFRIYLFSTNKTKKISSQNLMTTPWLHENCKQNFRNEANWKIDSIVSDKIHDKHQAKTSLSF